MYAAGWYPDPTGRQEYRYHNGTAWTGDVATSGQRYVDPLHGPAASGDASLRAGPAGAHRASGGNGIAVAALTCGILAIALGWIPLLFVIGAVLAVLALVFGAVGLRRAARTGRGRGFAIAGIVTGGVGVLAVIVGAIFTVLVWRAVDAYERPVDHLADDPMCEVIGGSVVGEGEIRNVDTTTGSFTVVVEIRRAASGVRLTVTRVRVDDVAPGETRAYDFTRRVEAREVTCVITDVKGPLPFGVVLD